MDWKEYEEITKYIYENLGKQSGVEIVCYGNSCKVKGKSDVEHQIDILTQLSDGIHSYRTAIECKYWNEKVNKDVVMKVAVIVQDALLNKGIIVSKLGFTEDAIKQAQSSNISLVELREMTDNDWEDRIRYITFDNTGHYIEPKPVLIKYEPSVPKEQMINGAFQMNFIQIKKPTGEIVPFHSYFLMFQKDLISELLETIEVDTEVEKEYSLEKGTLIIDTLNSIEALVLSLKFQGIHRVFNDTVEINGDDYIKLIMKAVFENKTYVVTRDNEVIERKNNWIQSCSFFCTTSLHLYNAQTFRNKRI